MKLQQWRMRTTLTVWLLLVSFGLTAMSLLFVHLSVQRQIRSGLDNDVQHSLATFQNLTRQQNEMLAREAALLADLPSLKALMSTGDKITIQDGSDEFWRLSGSDFFALISPDGQLYTHLNRGNPLGEATVSAQSARCLQRAPAPCLLFSDGRLYVLTAQRLFFGPPVRDSELGFIEIGYAVDSRVAREVSEAAAAEVVFQVGGQTAASTLPSTLLPGLRGEAVAAPWGASFDSRKLDISCHWLRLNGEEYCSASQLLGNTNDQPVDLIVLKSYDRASAYLQRLNRSMAALGILAILLGGLLAAAISRSVTRPLEKLVEGTRALGQGDFNFGLGSSGAVEVRELGAAFAHMRLELKNNQKQLIESDRLATIGRMASSISHDLRHHLSVIYANAEFMSLEQTGKDERVELLAEVQDAVQNMTDLIESLLLFSRTGQTLHRSFEPIFPLVERTAQAVRRHPEARDVDFTVELVDDTEAEVRMQKVSAVFAPTCAPHCAPGCAPGWAWIDALALSRAVYNLMLNACQAARQGSSNPRVRVTVKDIEDALTINIEDNGPGISESIRGTLFQPFVSADRENGTGLGLTLAQHIAQEHGGDVRLDEADKEITRFTIRLAHKAWLQLAPDFPGASKEDLPT